MPKVSVIIPVYNVEKYLKKCLDSVVHQTLSDIEIICVNDGSTDGSLSILQEYAKQDERIIVITQENKGGGAARNTGLGVAQGEFLYFLDSDDYVELTILEKMYNQSVQQNADICLCKRLHYLVDQNKIIECKNSVNLDIIPNICFSVNDIPNDIFQTSYIAPFNKLYRHVFIQHHDIKYQEIKSSNDMLFNAETFVLASKITYVDEYLVTSRRGRKNSISDGREKTNFCVFDASEAIKNMLIEKQMFDLVKKSFYKQIISCFFLDIHNSHRQFASKEFIRRVKVILPPEEQKIFFERYKKYRNSKIFQRIFSIRNEWKNGKKHKVITIMGVKIKLRGNKENR